MAKKVAVEEVEKEVQNEDDAIKRAEEIIAEQSKQQGLKLNDIPQIFHPDGLLETTDRLTTQIIKEVVEVIKKFDVGDVVIARGLKTEQTGEKGQVPNLLFAGEEVGIRFRVPPTDRYGNNGKKWLKEEEYDKLKARRNEKSS